MENQEKLSPTTANVERNKNLAYEAARMFGEKGALVLNSLTKIQIRSDAYFASPRVKDQFIVKFYGGNLSTPKGFLSFEAHVTPEGVSLFQTVNQGRSLVFVADFPGDINSISETALRDVMHERLEAYKKDTSA